MGEIQNIAVFGCILLLSYAAALPADKLKHYHGYKVIRASPETPTQFEVIHQLIAQDKYDFWRKPSQSGPADVMLSPTEYDQVTTVLHDSGIPFYTMIPNVESLLEQERQKKLAYGGTKRDMDWEDYHNFDEVNTWLSNLVAGSVNGTNIQITSEKYGTSLEGRDLLVYKVSTGGAGSGNSTTKSAIWIDATIHAREHITTAVLTYIINELMTNTTIYADILEQVDFYFVPFVNPDGFVYSHEFDRMWRKTRSNWLNSTCVGVDANRNFGFHWGETGASADPCSSGYHGPEPYSEPETKAIRDYILDKAQTQNVSWVTYITLHSYGQLWLSPWGYTVTPPEDHSEVLQVAKDAVAELKTYFNTSYVVGNSAAALYYTSGTSQDWAKGEGGFKFVYTIELRDTGMYGFLLPPEQILDTSLETWSGLQVLAREMVRRKMSIQKLMEENVI